MNFFESWLFVKRDFVLCIMLFLVSTVNKHSNVCIFIDYDFHHKSDIQITQKYILDINI